MAAGLQPLSRLLRLWKAGSLAVAGIGNLPIGNLPIENLEALAARYYVPPGSLSSRVRVMVMVRVRVRVRL